ncbi:hypothetical protein BKA70DRAFT_1438006 [Coprinopsis sp. MPI-PUGE-AT-0042]|nr:hypothetical protein BKA70DRAFT_1438006 [Coprinopsis sp. MPI-PUGE-AT-0042]
MGLKQATIASSITTSPAEDQRLKLLALLAMYDLLPHSISRPPNATAPPNLTTAIDAASLERCLQSMMQKGVLTGDEARAFSAAYNADVVEAK